MNLLRERRTFMNKIEMKELKKIVPQNRRIDIVDLIAPNIKNKINYFSNIIYGRKKLDQNQKENIYRYCVKNFKYTGDIQDLFAYTQKEEKEKNTNYYSDFATKIRMCIEKEKYFNNRTFEKIIKDSQYQDYSVSRSTLINYKNGNTQPAISEIENLSICLNVVPQFFKGTFLLPIDYMYKDQVKISESWNEEQEKNQSVFKELKRIITNIHNEKMPWWKDEIICSYEFPKEIYDGLDEYLIQNKIEFDNPKDYDNYIKKITSEYIEKKEDECIERISKKIDSTKFDVLFSDNNFYSKLTDFIHSFESEYFKELGLKEPHGMHEEIYHSLEYFQGANLKRSSQIENYNYCIHCDKIHIWAIKNKFIDYGSELNEKMINSCRDSIKFSERHLADFYKMNQNSGYK